MQPLADDEVLDVLDAEDLHTVGQKSRVQVHRDHDWHGIVFVWPAWGSAGSHRMLLQQRGREGDPFAQQVDALAGGHIGTGETFVEAARRELMEEVGLHARGDDLVELGSSRTERPTVECRRVVQHLLLYPQPLDIDDMQFSAEVDGFVVVDLQEFIDLVHGRRQQLSAQARYARQGGRLRTIELARAAVHGYPDEILDAFRRSLVAISTWLRDGYVDTAHF